MTVTTVVQNVNPRKTSVVLGDAERCCTARALSWIPSAARPMPQPPQLLPDQPQPDRGAVRSGCGSGASHRERSGADAYCGIGTIGLTAADHVKQVVGVELNRDAVQDAIGNAKHNGVKNARFFAADATRWISEAAAAGSVRT